ncbi:MAG TPA: hypothetical protein VM802_07895 [Chitinophaga sp.]|uniref:DUF6882 domain-containing protein n=1 Tax=Chitinophaga sp. TaxID=1869181 RepID=UPI002BEDC3F8|nr:DUF6882 domain-containing protein [Chitinophaga sp.]HVI44776.1 hypothetical protein [Chitinophaga sp.]
MSLFRKLFGQENAPTKKKPGKYEPMQHETKLGLIEKHGGIALDKQHDLSDLIGDNDWNADLEAGTITFGPHTFPIQVIGTYSFSSHTFLWAWANRKSDIAQALLQQATQLRKLGQDNDIKMFTQPQFDGDINDAHCIGLIASGLFDASAYYIANYGEGALLVTIKSDVIDQARNSTPFFRIPTVFPQLISLFEMHHRQALVHYLTSSGYEISSNEDGRQLSASRNGQHITASFDEQWRLTELKAGN